ncbi:MAG: heme A synthase [Bacteroidetes bacterium HGW-Bacteroidetes-2]|jgi:cytochrome c oxidase assembly protein subunit 15|nr:MAG: heme A synthase [Bacteroidetes bacterium HGW-Bacteroidetes-2]
MEKNQKSVIIWLLTGCFLVFIMVIVGGITRLTDSGLSMTDWHIITEVIPPLSENAWEAAFEDYKKYPEYKKINIHNDFTLEDYKEIYFWEWLHRLLGRLLGVVFIIPFFYFLIKKKLTKETLKNCYILLFLGGFQGFLGWYMVKSGLIDHPNVSHYRLAMHLTTAFITFAFTFWVALNLMYPKQEIKHKPLRNLLRFTLTILLLQIIWGAFVAGLNAGWIHNTWPFMNDGKLIHETVTIEQTPIWKNFVEGKSGVQFVHRYLAYVVVALVLWIGYNTKKRSTTISQKRGVNSLLILVFIQFVLGVFTLLLAVPLWLGVLHQVGAFFLLGAMTFTLHRFSK